MIVKHRLWDGNSAAARQRGKNGYLIKIRKTFMVQLLDQFFKEKGAHTMTEQEVAVLKRCIDEIRAAKTSREIAIESSQLIEYVRDLCAYYQDPRRSRHP